MAKDERGETLGRRGVGKRGAYSMFVTAAVFHRETSPLNADAENMDLWGGTSGSGWAQHRCNTAEGGRERESGQQDEGDGAGDRSVEQRAQQPEMGTPSCEGKEAGVMARWRQGWLGRGERGQTLGRRGVGKREAYPMSVTAAVFHRETSRLNLNAPENMCLGFCDVRIGLGAV